MNFKSKLNFTLIGVFILSILAIVVFYRITSKNSVSIDTKDTQGSSQIPPQNLVSSSISSSISIIKNQVKVDIAGENLTKILSEIGADMGFVSSTNILELGQKLPIKIDSPIQIVDEGIYPVRVDLNSVIPKPVAPNNLVKSTIAWEKYNLNAPIIWSQFSDLFETTSDGFINFEKSLDTNSTTTPIQKKLEQGTVHLPYSPLPGEIGNSYIIGHSSNFSFVKSDYNTVFKAFEMKSQPGEEFFIYDFFGRELRFRVFETLVVNEADIAEAFKNFGSRRVVTLQSSILENGQPTKRWLTRAELIIE